MKRKLEYIKKNKRERRRKRRWFDGFERKGCIVRREVRVWSGVRLRSSHAIFLEQTTWHVACLDVGVVVWWKGIWWFDGAWSRASSLLWGLLLHRSLSLPASPSLSLLHTNFAFFLTLNSLFFFRFS